MSAAYAYIGAAVVFWALLSGWMFVVSKRHLSLRLLGAATVLALAFLIWINLTSMLGYAVAAVPHGTVEVLGIIDARLEGSIYLWIREPSGPRAYRLPYSEGLAKKLLQAQQQQHAGGGRIMARFDGKGHDEGRDVNHLAGPGGLRGDDHGPHVRVNVVPAIPPKT